MSDNPLISVIVPVFNSEQYLEDCITSVIRQSYKNLELLLIDDGSTDNSGEICDSFSSKDSRIRVIHKKNGGVSSARNIGLDYAQGELISFLDSDDMLTDDCLQELYIVMLSHSADIVAGTAENEKYHREYFALGDVLWKDDEGLKNSLKDHLFTYATWAKLYTRKIIGSTRFDEKYKINEDSLFVFMLLCKKPKFIGKDLPVYIYRKNANSASRSSFSEKYFDIIGVSEFKYNLIIEKFPEYKDLAENMKIKAQMNMLSILATRTNLFEFLKIKKELIINISRDKKYFVPVGKHDLSWFRVVTSHLFFVYAFLYKVKRKLTNRGVL